MSESGDVGSMLTWSSFAVDATPRAMWGVELREQNLAFLEGIDPTFFTYAAEAHLAALEGPSRQHAAMAIRVVYGQAVETLFALLGAAVQAPNCPLGWILSYSGPQLYSVVRKLHGEASQGPFYAREGSPGGWHSLSRKIHRFTHPDPNEDERIKTLFADTWARLAHEFLDPLTGEEYNSIKHGFRARAGGSSLTIGPNAPGGPILDSRSEFGSRFFHAVKLGDKVNFYAQDAMRNWTPIGLAVRIELIAVSIRNVISYLQLYLGANSEGQIPFRWPEATCAIELAWQSAFVVESASGGYQLAPSDITPLSPADILGAYDPADTTSTAE